MDIKTSLCILLLVLHSSAGRAQSCDSLSAPTQSWHSYLPAAAGIGYGLANHERDAPLGANLDGFRNTKQHRSSFFSLVQYGIAYTPAAAVYAMDMAGVPPRHDFWQRSKIFAAGNVMMFACVFSLKQILKTERPNARDNGAFPSGHSAAAFLAADFFYQEYRDRNRWWVYSGYAVATAVGVYRIRSGEHWLSDVAAGAGFGLLSDRLSYLIFDRRRSHPGE